MTRRPNTSCTSTAAPSFSMSTSATRITEFSPADSVRTASSFASAPFFLSSDFGLPSGKAVLNFPLSRSASGRDLLSDWKPLVAASPETVATMLSTSIELVELLISSVTFSPSTGLTSKAPPNA